MICVFLKPKIEKNSTRMVGSNCESSKIELAYLVALYSGHHGQAQQSNNVKIARAMRRAKQMSNQNSTRFSALYTFCKSEPKAN